MKKVNVHVVHVDKKKKFSSATLPSDALLRLETAFGAGSWWRDKWTAKAFRAAARDVLREHGGLVLIGPSVKFEVPPPFSEMFEPIEISTGLSDDRERLKTISGEAPTREERWQRVGKWIAVFFGFLGVLMLWVAYLHGMPKKAVMILVPMMAGIFLLTFGIISLVRLSGRWFLIPGGIAMVRRPIRRGQPPRVTVLSRRDSCLVLRYVHAGKVTVLTAELLTHSRKTVSRALSEREAVSLVATWQGEATPPDDSKLMELVSW